MHAAKAKRRLGEEQGFFWDASSSLPLGTNKVKVDKAKVAHFLRDFQLPTFQGSAPVQDFVIWKSAKPRKRNPEDVKWLPDDRFGILGSKSADRLKPKIPPPRNMDVNWLPDAVLGELGSKMKLKLVIHTAKLHGMGLHLGLV